jgi:serine/threonine protein kinase
MSLETGLTLAHYRITAAIGASAMGEVYRATDTKLGREVAIKARPAAAPSIVSAGWLLGAVGEVDAAFEVFARAEDGNQLWFYYAGLPGFDPLQADPRVAALVARLGLPNSPV